MVVKHPALISPELFRNIIDDILPERVHGKIKFDRRRQNRFVGRGGARYDKFSGKLQFDGNTAGDFVCYFVFILSNNQQAHGMGAKMHPIRFTDCCFNIDKNGKTGSPCLYFKRSGNVKYRAFLAIFIRGKNSQLSLSGNTQIEVVIRKDNRLGRIASFDGITRIDDVIAGIRILIDRQ